MSKYDVMYDEVNSEDINYLFDHNDINIVYTACPIKAEVTLSDVMKYEGFPISFTIGGKELENAGAFRDNGESGIITAIAKTINSFPPAKRTDIIREIKAANNVARFYILTFRERVFSKILDATENTNISQEQFFNYFYLNESLIDSLIVILTYCYLCRNINSTSRISC